MPHHHHRSHHHHRERELLDYVEDLKYQRHQLKKKNRSLEHDYEIELELQQMCAWQEGYEREQEFQCQMARARECFERMQQEYARKLELQWIQERKLEEQLQYQIECVREQDRKRQLEHEQLLERQQQQEIVRQQEHKRLMEQKRQEEKKLQQEYQRKLEHQRQLEQQLEQNHERELEARRQAKLKLEQERQRELELKAQLEKEHQLQLERQIQQEHKLQQELQCQQEQIRQLELQLKQQLKEQCQREHQLEIELQHEQEQKRQVQLELQQERQQNAELQLLLGKQRQQELKPKLENEELQQRKKRSSEWEIEPEELIVSVQVEGSFGKVYKGKLGRYGEQVAVKIVNENYKGYKEFINEAETLVSLTSPHVVKIYGVSLMTNVSWIVTEFMKNGSLLSYLKTNQPHLYQNSDFLLNMSYQVCEGMKYLEDKGVVHCNLQAQSCLVGSENVVKISVHTLTRYLPVDINRNDSSGVNPIRWASPETIRRGEFSSKSDVWSFGVLMWEIFTSGLTPYESFSNQEVVAFVNLGNTLEIPDGCPFTIYQIMKSCWKPKANDRPSFTMLEEKLKKCQSGSVSSIYLDDLTNEKPEEERRDQGLKKSGLVADLIRKFDSSHLDGS